MNTLVILALLAQAPAATGWLGREPQLAGSERRVFLSFVRDGAIVVLRSADQGRTFDEVSAIRPAGPIAVGNHRGPRIAVTERVVIVSAIVGEQGGGKDGDIVAYRSTDEGRSWSSATVFNAVRGSAREGLHGTAANAGGVVAAAWLDLRQTGTRVFSAVSRDGAATWAHDVGVYASPSGSVCECCHPSAVVSADGRVGVMFSQPGGGTSRHVPGVVAGRPLLRAGQQTRRGHVAASSVPHGRRRCGDGRCRRDHDMAARGRDLPRRAVRAGTAHRRGARSRRFGEWPNRRSGVDGGWRGHVCPGGRTDDYRSRPVSSPPGTRRRDAARVGARRARAGAGRRSLTTVRGVRL